MKRFWLFCFRFSLVTVMVLGQLGIYYLGQESGERRAVQERTPEVWSSYYKVGFSPDGHWLTPANRGDLIEGDNWLRLDYKDGHLTGLSADSDNEGPLVAGLMLPFNGDTIHVRKWPQVPPPLNDSMISTHTGD